MTEMFSPKQIHRNPTGLKLVKEVSLQEVSDWLLELCEGLPQQILEKVRDLKTLEEGLRPILREQKEGDRLWLAQSEHIGPLYGNRGIALVRENRPVIYLRVIQF